MGKKVLILGHGRHGKDTLAEYLEKYFGIPFISSSFGAAEAIFAGLQYFTDFKYEYVEDAFEDRHNYRPLWKQLITEYNADDKARLCKEILSKSDCYVGMRCKEEYEASKHLFDLVIWVDASERIGYIDPTMGIEFDDSMFHVDNNGDEANLMMAAINIFTILSNKFHKIKTIHSLIFLYLSNF